MIAGVRGAYPPPGGSIVYSGHMVPSVVMSVLRTAAQALGGYVFTFLVSHGINVPVEAQSYVVNILLVTAGVGLWTAAVRFLETRKGEGPLARGARALARLLMFGLSKQPVYVDRQAVSTVEARHGTSGV